MAAEDPSPPPSKKPGAPPKRRAAARKPRFTWKVPKKLPPPKPSKKPFWQVWVDAGKSIPKEEWDKVPHDGSINYKHYLYGDPKKTLDD